MSNYSLDPINISPEEFLGAFFEPAEKVCLRVFSDKADSAFSGAKLEVEQGHFKKLADLLKQHNDSGRGIYFVINHGGHEDADIKRINAQFMECDDIPLEEQFAKIQTFPLEPSLIVKTRKSLHCYWLMKNANVERFRYIQRGLIAHFGADPACVNESRVFRLPGFYHCKEEPIMVEVIKFSPHLRYTQEQLTEVLPYVSDEPVTSNVAAVQSSPIRNCGTQKGYKLVGYRCAFMKYCKSNAKTLPEPLWYAMITNLAIFEGGADAIHKLSRPYPKYSLEQTENKIAHFIKSGTKPMTCEKLSQLGFICPKLKSCHAKAPSALAFRPLETTDLRKLLASCKPKRNPTDDVATARTFVLEYMYNFDAGLAETLINSEIKAHFGFKAADLKQIISYQKLLYREFSTSQEARRERQSGEIPAWYEVSDRGKWKFLPGELANYCIKNENVIYCADSYYFYEDGVYLPRNDKTAQRRIRSYMNTRYALASEIKDAEWQWCIEIDKTVREININPYILNFKNGLYDIITNEFVPHDPKVLSTIRLGGNYDPAAKCPTFMTYLSDVLPETEVPLIQEILGYTILQSM